MTILTKDYSNFKNYDDIEFTVSTRNKIHSYPIVDFLQGEYSPLRFNQITSVYGFVNEFCVLYGGRSFKEEFTMSFNDIDALYDNNIALRLPLTNQLITLEDYKNSKQVLAKYHRKGNRVIVTKTELAEWIRNDYPEYKIDCSTIKNIAPEKIDSVLDNGLWDTVVLSARFNPELDRITQIKNKDKVVVFANSKCGWTCQTPTCYMQVSQHNLGLEETYVCSEDGGLEKVVFDIDKLVELGFSRFKLTPLTEQIGQSLDLL